MKLGKRILALAMAFTMCMTSSVGTIHYVSATDVDESDTSYTVSLAETENGSIAFYDSESNQTSTESSKEYKQGEQVEVCFVPDEGYRVSKFVIHDAEENELYSEETSDDIFEFTMPDSDLVISGEFLDDITEIEGTSTTHYIDLNINKKIANEVKEISQDIFETENLDQDSLEEIEKISKYDENGLAETPYCLLTKCTFYDTDMAPEGLTIDEMFSKYEDSMIATYDYTYKIYETKDSDDYLVAYINANNSLDGKISDFAVTTDENENPVDLSSAIKFDKESGIVYLPKSYFYDKEGTQGCPSIRTQTLFGLSMSDNTTKSVEVNINNENSHVDEVGEAFTTNVSTFDTTTTIPLVDKENASKISLDQLKVYVNDSVEEYDVKENAYFSQEDGSLMLAVSPINVYKLTVDVEETNGEDIPILKAASASSIGNVVGTLDYDGISELEPGAAATYVPAGMVHPGSAGTHTSSCAIGGWHLQVQQQMNPFLYGISSANEYGNLITVGNTGIPDSLFKPSNNATVGNQTVVYSFAFPTVSLNFSNGVTINPGNGSEFSGGRAYLAQNWQDEKGYVVPGGYYWYPAVCNHIRSGIPDATGRDWEQMVKCLAKDDQYIVLSFASRVSHQTQTGSAIFKYRYVQSSNAFKITKKGNEVSVKTSTYNNGTKQKDGTVTLNDIQKKHIMFTIFLIIMYIHLVQTKEQLEFVMKQERILLKILLALM